MPIKKKEKWFCAEMKLHLDKHGSNLKSSITYENSDSNALNQKEPGNYIGIQLCLFTVFCGM
jgi:hypothetical protein